VPGKNPTIASRVAAPTCPDDFFKFSFIKMSQSLPVTRPLIRFQRDLTPIMSTKGRRSANNRKRTFTSGFSPTPKRKSRRWGGRNVTSDFLLLAIYPDLLMHFQWENNIYVIDWLLIKMSLGLSSDADGCLKYLRGGK
jgi:hypothetical protein